MNTLLFSLNNVLVSMDGDSFDVDDEDYSCLWDVYRAGRSTVAMIDLKSFRRKEWGQGKASWVKTTMLDTVVAQLEERLQRQVEREADENRANVREVAEMRA